MIHYNSIDTYEGSRGLVFIVNSLFESKGRGEEWIGQEVIIDNLPYIVKGIESQALMGIKIGDTIGVIGERIPQ